MWGEPLVDRETLPASTHPTQIKSEFGSGFHSPLRLPGRCWGTPLPIRQWAAGGGGFSALWVGAKGKRKSGCPRGFSDIWSRVPLLVPHPERNISPQKKCFPSSSMQRTAHIKGGRKDLEELFKRGGGEGNAARKNTEERPPRSRSGWVRACACLCVRSDDKAPPPPASFRLSEHWWGRGGEGEEGRALARVGSGE